MILTQSQYHPPAVKISSNYNQNIIKAEITSQTRKTPSCFPSGSSTLMPLASLVYTVQLHLHGFNVKVNDDVDGDVGCNEFSI